MTSPQMSNIPGAAVMTDTLDFVKNLWGSMGVPGIGLPGIATPTLSVDELEKKINDLRAVEAWLNLNATMVRSSIQALEVQRGTINALKSMGKTLAAAMQQPSSGEHSLFDTMPYAAFFQPPGAKTEAAGKSGAAKSGAATPAKDEAKAEDKGAASAKPSMADAASAAAAQMANPAIWWNLLQEQFKQAVNSTMAADLGGIAKPAAQSAPNDKASATQPGAAEAKDAAAGQAAPAAKADGGTAGTDAAKDVPPSKGGSTKAAVNGAAKADTASSKAPARKPAAKRNAPQPK
ncbi:PhaM family polyhydroxyalkanoate granule multifunctional regulatory protein [Massilia sp. erpn]|uniref:PhaM family polyhydroxyalkanoate granule multifunctional regulatory protein n=1 Tax=Massilia sp. erpn TaxID=2738142 RepID=UPI0021055D6B|nr:PhaM family polyhydroxyalkanoate granule multifunctional regulatory protein [Massilia sp. erpn]